ncbi:MAG TPA: glycine cleavage T C-terminal barrel domain-containing protein [Phycisphaerales bacterium]|nr:glycine cleavage T C-terminal barrel domain-containing protein [Phycisphaerales bacterium]
MTRDWPLRKLHEELAVQAPQPAVAAVAHAGQSDGTHVHRPGAAQGSRTEVSSLETISYSPPPFADSAAKDSEQRWACELVGTYGSVETEYAALRRSAGLLDCAHRGTLVVTGSERMAFLNRMLTAELKTLKAGGAVESFWLNRKGRIEADLLLAELGERMIIGVDLAQADSACRTLSDFIFSEDIKIENASRDYWHLALHGPKSLEILSRAGGSTDTPSALKSLEAIELTISGVKIIAIRIDQIGDVGLQLIVPTSRVEHVCRTLLEAGAKPVGWYAYNIARIEGGTPLFNIDFGTTNLPHETGALKQRVHFAKGCYLGQEVVARMENLGKPKQMLVGLKMKADALPVAGGQVFEMKKNENDNATNASDSSVSTGMANNSTATVTKEGEAAAIGNVIGVVTSSTISPMLSAQPVAFAMIRTAHANAENTVIVNAEGRQVEAVISGLTMWEKRTEGAHAAHA